MKASWEKIEKNLGILTVEVEQDKVNAALDQAFKKVRSRITVPGFRKGKVPRAIFEKRYGVESLYQEALDILLPEVYVEAVRQTGIEPIDRPDIEVEQFGKNQEFKFKAKVQVKPEVELGEYKGLEVPVQDAAVTAEDIEAELKRLQERHAELVVIDEGAAQEGDIVVIDFEGFIDGQPFEGGKAEKYQLELGSRAFIPGFEEQLVGMELGDDKEIQVTFPEDYHAEALKGKTATFKVKLHDIKRKNLPALDDEFAKDVSEFDTLEEFKQDIEKRLQEQKLQERKRAKEAAVIQKASENAKVEIPEVMIENEVNRMLNDFANRLRMQGMNLNMYYQLSGQTEEMMKEQMKGDAETRVRNNLVLEAIAAAEKIEVSEEELDKELESLAKAYQKPVEELRRMLEANGSLDNLREDLVLRKTVDFLVEHSKESADVA